MRGVFGVAGLGVKLGEKEIEQAGIGSGALLENGADAAFLGEDVGIKRESLAECAHGFGILFVAVIGIAEVAVDGGGLLVALESFLVITDGAAIALTLVFERAEVVHGAGEFLVGLHGF